MENEAKDLYDERLKEFEDKLKICFCDKSLLIRALSHRSRLEYGLTSKKENKKLGLIGDKLIDLVLFEYSYNKVPSPEDMDTLRQQSSSRQALNIAMRSIMAEPPWFLNPGTERRTREKSAKLGEDTFEALVGAIYLDQGFEAAECFVRRYLQKGLT
jgi:ribonuclease-3